ncbi:MAG: hypothetical protein ACXVCY_15045 [Pseudobdellovibrionaceae bacterium]
MELVGNGLVKSRRKTGRTKEERFDAVDLCTRSEKLLEQLLQYIIDMEAAAGVEGINLSILNVIVDLSDSRSKEIWREINLFLNSPKATEARIEQLFKFLSCIDSRGLTWSWADKRNSKEQVETVMDIGQLAAELKKKISTAQIGNVSNFLDWWEKEYSKKKLPISSFFQGEAQNNWRGLFAFYNQENVIKIKSKATIDLLIRLASLSEAARGYSPLDLKHTPLVGMKSQKRDALTFFVINLHIALEEIFGKSTHILNANLTSIKFKANVSNKRIKDIVDRAKQRGDILPQKSKKSPLR